MLMCLWMGECPVSESPDIPPVPEPMEEGAAVDAAARALHDLFHEENETGLGPDDCRDECVSPPSIWRAAARAAIDAISYPALLAELSRQAAVVELLRQVYEDPTLALGYAVVHRDTGWDDEGNYVGTGEITHTEPEGRWRRETRAALAALDTP